MPRPGLRPAHRISMGRAIALSLLIGTLNLFLNGCGPDGNSSADLHVDQITGTWTSPDGGIFQFATDGTVKASDLRGEAIMSEFEGRRLSASGTWKIAPDTYDREGPSNTVRLGLDLRGDAAGRSDDLGNWGGALRVDDAGAEFTLIFFIDDPDLGIKYRFVRAGAATPSSQ